MRSDSQELLKTLDKLKTSDNTELMNTVIALVTKTINDRADARELCDERLLELNKKDLKINEQERIIDSLQTVCVDIATMAHDVNISCWDKIKKIQKAI